MTVEIFANQPATAVTAGGSDAPPQGTSQTWTVRSSSSFPAASATAAPPTQFHIADTNFQLSTEIIAVTNVSGNTWTVTRGAESTTPVKHLAGFTVTTVVTAAGLRGFASLRRPATIIVAASNSSAAWRTQADYVCTGANDDLVINAAMAALPNSGTNIGGKVLLSDGRFTISNPLIPTINNTALVGQGVQATTVKQQPGTGTNGYQFDQTKQAYSLIFCSIEGILFLGNYNDGTGDTTGYGGYINYTYPTGGGNQTFWDFMMRDVWFDEWPQDGFRSTGGHGYVLDHVLGEYCGGNGITFTGGFEDSPPRIVEGTFKLNVGAGVSVSTLDTYVGHCEISGNQGAYGLIMSGQGCKAVGNRIINNIQSGVHITGGVEGCQMVANTVSFNKQHGLLLDNANTTVTGNLFASNSFTNTGVYDEINIAHGTFSAVGNQIVGNIIDCSSSSRYGINFSVSSDTAGVAVANRIIGAVTGAVNAQPDTYLVATGNLGLNYANLSVLLAPSGATGETHPRSSNSQYTAVLTTQQSYVSAIPLLAGLTVSNLGVLIGSTGFTGVNHGWLALLDKNLVVRAVTGDQTSSFGSANTALQLAAGVPYTTTYTGIHYIAMCATASGMGTLALGPAPLNGSVTTPPVLSGTSTGSLTTPPTTGTTLAAITPSGSLRFYGYTA